MDHICLVCFNPTGNTIFIPAEESSKIFSNCLTFLHAAIAENCNNDFEVGKEKKCQLPFCKSCFDCAVHLTQLNIQLASFQKEISDLTVEFSLGVMCRRKASNDAKSISGKKTVELEAGGFPDELFDTKLKHKLPEINPFEDEEEENANNFTTLNKKDCSPDDEDEGELVIDFYDETEDVDNIPLADRSVRKVEEDPLNVATTYTSPVNKNRKTIGKIEVTESTLLRSAKNPKVEPERVRPEGLRQIITPTKKATLYKKSFPRVSSSEESDSDEDMPKLTRAEGSNKVRHTTAFDRIKPSDIITDKRKAPTAHLQKTLKLMRKVVRTKSELRTNAEKFKCETCSNYFTSRNYLIVHRRIHTGEKPFKCNICNRHFIQGAHLSGHMKTHTGEKPFKCAYCIKTFTSDVHRRRHQLIHTGEKPYKCLFCARTFNTAGNKNRHQLLHSNKKKEVIKRGRKKGSTNKAAKGP